MDAYNWSEQLTVVDVTFLVVDGVLLAAALASGIAIALFLTPRLRRHGRMRRANAVLALSAAQIFGLVVSVPLLRYATIAELTRFGAENMLPMFVAPAARLGAVLVGAVLCGNAMTYVFASDDSHEKTR